MFRLRYTESEPGVYSYSLTRVGDAAVAILVNLLNNVFDWGKI